ncbi:MAG: NUDIX domain-containing protein [Limisphaerales bacterium]
MSPSDHFRCCPACGSARRDEPGGSPFRCEGCGFTYYFNASISAAVFLRRADGRVLFIRRARDPGRGKLAPPGGFVDVGERVEEALRREIREEVGLEIGDTDFLGSFPNQYPYLGVTYPVLDLFFSALAVRPDSARALDDVDGVMWLDPVSEVTPDDMAFPSMRAALQLLRERSSPAEV